MVVPIFLYDVANSANETKEEICLQIASWAKQKNGNDKSFHISKSCKCNWDGQQTADSNRNTNRNANKSNETLSDPNRFGGIPFKNQRQALIISEKCDGMTSIYVSIRSSIVEIFAINRECVCARASIVAT